MPRRRESAPTAPADCPPAPPECACASIFDWKKVPRVRPLPRIGNFPVLPTGPGYYSALDQLRGECLKAPPKYPYPRFGIIQPSFFDVDNFSYLDDPKNTEHDFFDPLKRIRLGDNWLFVTGGDVRSRYENQYNARLAEANNSYDLSRARVYGDLWYRDDFRVYAEYIGAWSSSQELVAAADRREQVRPAQPVRRREDRRPRREPGVCPRRPAGAAVRLAAAHLAARLGEHAAHVPGRARRSARRRSGTSTCSGSSR